MALSSFRNVETLTTKQRFQLTLVRHGETSENNKRIIQGQTNTLLNENGQQQAILVGRRLSQERFTCVYSSDLSRAKDTADIVVSYLRQRVEVITDSRLRERCFGECEGKPLAALVDAAKVSGKSVVQFTPVGGETLDAVTQRATQFLQDLFRQKSGGHILVVSHGGLIRALLDVLQLESGEKLSCGCSVSPNTGVTSLDVTYEQNDLLFRCVALTPFHVYDIAHLQ